MAKRGKKSARAVAVGYVRVSSRQQRDEGTSLLDQRDDIIRHCVVSNFDLHDIYEDAAISGGKDETARPGLAAALTALREGRASVLVVKHLDRLSRDSDLAGHLRIELKRMGCVLDIVDEVKGDPIRRAVDALAAELEKIRGSQRMKFSHRARQAKGIWTGGAPYGFRLVAGRLLADREEQQIIHRVSSLRSRGFTVRAITHVLNNERLPARHGGRWSVASVHQILRRLNSEAFSKWSQAATD